MRTPLVKFDDIPGRLPEASVPEDADYLEIAQSTLAKLNNLDLDDLEPAALWRDLLSLTDTFRTFHSAQNVMRTLSKLSSEKQRSKFSLDSSSSSRKVQVPDPPTSWLEFNVSFTTRYQGLTGNGTGVVSVARNSTGDWKIWMLRTWLENYEGHGHPDTINDGRDINKNKADDTLFDAAIVGGGQGGLGVAGRLTALGISNILFDNRPSIGDSWAHRYKILKWHTIKEYGNLPFGRTFTQDDPNLLPIERIASAYKEWARKHSLNFREETSIQRADWDDSSHTWTITGTTSGKTYTWRARNLVLTIGSVHTSPVSPDWSSSEAIESSGFQGTILHSRDYHSARPFAGKRGIVIGSANTAHDVAEDMANEHMEVTMVQRSPTFIVPGEWLVASQSKDYNRSKATEISDRESLTYPSKISRDMANRFIHSLIKQHPQRFDDLERAGFKLDRFGDLATNRFIRNGGNYVDIGSCQRIIDGEIKIKTDAVRTLTKDGLVFADGSVVQADVIVLATGFNHNFRKEAAAIVGQKVANQMDEYYGPDAEGELRAYARLAGHPHLYYGGGDAQASRFFSRFIALQIQKECLGVPLRPYLEGRG